MDFFKGVGDFFNSIFGGNKDDEERKRREREAARKKQQAQRVQPKAPTLTLDTQKVEKSKTSKPVAPKNNPGTMSIDQFMLKPKTAAPVKIVPAATPAEKQEKQRQVSSIISGSNYKPTKNYLSEDEYKSAVKRRDEINRNIKPNNPLVTIGQGLGDVFVRPVVDTAGEFLNQVSANVNAIQRGANVFSKENADTLLKQYKDDFAKGKITREQYDAVEKKVRARQGENERAISVTEEKGGTRPDASKGVTAGLMTAANLWGIEAIPAAVVSRMRQTGTTQGLEAAADEAIKYFKDTIKRNPTNEEEQLIREQARKEVVDEVNKAGTATKAGSGTPEVIPVKPQPTEKVSPDLPTKQQIADSYKDTYNQIQNDPNLPDETRASFFEEAKNRHAELLKQIDDTATRQAEVVANAAKTQADETAQLQENVQAQQLAQAEAVAPPVNAPEPPRPADNAEQIANNPYRSVDDYVAEQTTKRESLTESPAKAMFDSVRRELYDPRLVEQRYANQELKRLKAEGLIDKKASSLNPQDNITYWTGVINNPGQPAMSHLKESGIDKIFKKYGKESGKKAQNFANYRQFREELWLMSPEGGSNPNSLGVDPNEMAQFVQKYEAGNSDAIKDNATLRAFSLSNMARRAEAGIDSQEHLANSARNPFYTPRESVIPEEAVRPTFSGFVSRAIKGTQSRGEASPVSISPLRAYYKDAIDTERGLATQQRSQVFKEMADAGVDGFQVNVDPALLVKQRENLKTMDELQTAILEARKARDAIKGDTKKTTAQLSKAEKQATKAEEKVISKMQELLVKAKGSEDQALGDVVNRDPRYAQELAEIKSQKFLDENLKLSTQEKRDQIKADIAALNEKYPQPGTINRQGLLDLARSLGDEFAQTGKLVGDATESRSIIPGIEADVDALRGMFNQSKEELNTLREQSAQTWQDIMDTAQTGQKNVNAVPIKLDGETGNILIPTDLAKEYAKQNEAYLKQGWDKVLGGVAGAVKTTWTGLLSPVFQTLQVMKNVPLLYRNAEGSTGINVDALQGFANQLIQTQRGRAFRRALDQRGASFETATLGRNITRETADDIAARANLYTFVARNPVKSFRDVTQFLNSGLAYVQNAQRAGVARGVYERAIRMGADEETALRMAAEAPAKVLGDLNRVSDLARMLEPIIPYTGATQAGARALARATKERPFETTFKDASILAGFGGLAAYSMSNNKDYYKDMIESGKEYELDTNIPIVLPGAHRATPEEIAASGGKLREGDWIGVMNVPLTPDFRPFNRSVWRSMLAATDDDPETNVNGAEIAANIFNEFTGDQALNLFDPSNTDDGRNIANGILSGSPVGNLFKVAQGNDPRTGNPLADEATSRLPRTEQVRTNTSPFAQWLSDTLGGLYTPIQVDAFLSQLGSTGKTLKQVGDETTANPIATMFDVVEPFKPGRGQTQAQKDYLPVAEDIDAVAGLIDPADTVTFRKFQALHSKKTDKQKESMLNSAQKALDFVQYTGDGSFTTTPLYAAEAELNRRAIERGQPGNPLFELSPQELQKVLTYRSMKIPNAAGQNYTKDGEGAFASLGLDNEWYQNFRDNETAYYKAILGDKENEEKTFSGKPKPKLSDEQKQAQNQYFALPEKSEERRNFLAANSWLKDYWAADNDMDNEERKALGFSQLEEFDSGKGYSSGGGYTDTENVLNWLTNNGDDIQRLESLVGDKDVALSLQKFFAPRRGGRASVTIGAKASGR